MIDRGEAEVYWGSLNDEQQETVASNNFNLWARLMVTIPDVGEDGGPPDFDEHPWFEALYDIDSKEWHDLVIRKAVQIGVTTWAVLYAFWGATYRWARGFIYYLPHDEHVGPMVKQKVNPVLEQTPVLLRSMRGNLGAVETKQFRRSTGYFLGIASKGNRSTKTADIIFRDERDDMEQEHVDEVKDRTRRSRIRRAVNIGVPTVENYGIDAEFMESTQNWWTMTCACDHEWTVEESWPACVKIKADGAGTLACPKCGKYARIQDGRWVARNPKAKAIGYTFNGAMNPAVDLADVLREYDTGKNRHLWIRSWLGMPAIRQSGNNLSSPQILARCCDPERGGGYPQVIAHEGPTYFGCDTGASAATRRAYIAEKLPNGRKRVLKLWKYKSLEDLKKNIEMFHVEQGVIDAGGEPTLARDLCEAFPRKIYRCSFKEGVLNAKWDESKGTVSVDRTTFLDDSRGALYSETVLPSADDEDVITLAREVAAQVSVEEKTSRGDTIVRYVSHGSDHGGMTFGYLDLAMSKKKRKHIAKAVGGADSRSIVQRILKNRGLIER